MKRFCDPKLCRSDFIPPVRKTVRSLKSPHIHSHFKDKLVLNLYITSWALWTRLQVTLTRGNYCSLKHHLLSGALITSRKSGLGRKTGKWTDFPILDCHMYFSFSYAACCWCGVLFSFINCPLDWSASLQSYHFDKPSKAFLGGRMHMGCATIPHGLTRNGTNKADNLPLCEPLQRQIPKWF